MKITRVAVIPDIHAPKHHKKSVDAVFEFLKFYKPKLCIQLGDWCDYSSLSRFAMLKEDELVGLRQEEGEANDLLDRLDSILPNGCEKVMCEGNHDRRPETYNLGNFTGDMKKITGKKNLDLFHEAYNLKKRGWSWVGEGRCFEFGKALFTHGWFINSFHAKKTVSKFFKTIIYGHTHSYQTHCINGMDGLPVAGMSIGTLSRFDLGYLHGVPQDWCNMFMTMDFFGNGFFTAHPIPIIKGQFCKMGKVWG